MNKEQLLARSKELNISVPEGATNQEIANLIKIAEHPALTADLKVAEEKVTEVEGKLTVAEEKVTEVEGKLTDAEEKLADALESKATKETPVATYQNGDDTYVFTVENFRFKGLKHNASEAVKNEELMTALIEAEFINLKKQ